MKYLKRDYDLVGFEVSKSSSKKYDAIIKNKKTGQIVRIPFGAHGMEQYKDQTGLKIYSKFDHLDEVRKNSYQKRFQKLYDPGYFSPTFFSWVYLWNGE